MKVLVRVRHNQDEPARFTYEELEIRESAGEKWLAFVDGPESMPLDMVPDAIEKGGWYAQAGGMGCPEEFIASAELERMLEIIKLMDLRDKLTSTLKEIVMFDSGRASDLATAVLQEVGCWSKEIQRVDGQQTRFFPHRPHRGSDVEAFIKARRDRQQFSQPPREWFALDMLLDDYRLHADTGTPLTEPTPVDGGEPSLAQGRDGSAEAIDIDFLKRVATITHMGGMVRSQRRPERDAGLLVTDPASPGVLLTLDGWKLVREHGWNGDSPA